MDGLFESAGITLPHTNPVSRSESITRIEKYLGMQDVLECRTHKEIHSLAVGIYDSIVAPLLVVFRITTESFLKHEAVPYGQLNQPLSYSNNEKL